jgi:hypothetical protein
MYRRCNTVHSWQVGVCVYSTPYACASQTVCRDTLTIRVLSLGASLEADFANASELCQSHISCWNYMSEVGCTLQQSMKAQNEDNMRYSCTVSNIGWSAPRFCRSSLGKRPGVTWGWLGLGARLDGYGKCWTDWDSFSEPPSAWGVASQ